MFPNFGEGIVEISGHAYKVITYHFLQYGAFRKESNSQANAADKVTEKEKSDCKLL